MIAAFVIRLASLSLPKKIRQKYLRAWLAELQDAKEDGEAWAFAYDLLVNMGSLKKAAQGEEILYRNRSKTPLWLSMGSLGTAVLATVVAVSFWNGLKTPTNYTNAPANNLDGVVQFSQDRPSAAFIDAQAVTTDTVEADFEARARQDNSTQKTANAIAPEQSQEFMIETIQQTNAEAIEILSEAAPLVQLDAAASNNNTAGAGIPPASPSEPQVEVATESIEEVTTIPTTEGLITPNVAARAATPAMPNIESEIVAPAEISALVEEVAEEETESASEGSDENIVQQEAGEAADSDTAQAVIALAPVQVVGTPGVNGIPNIPGVETSVDTNTTVTTEAEANSTTSDTPITAAPAAGPVAPPAAISPPPPAAAAPAPVIVEVQTSTADNALDTADTITSTGALNPTSPVNTIGSAAVITPLTPSTVDAAPDALADITTAADLRREFQAPDNLDTTIVIRESELERPNISEDIQNLQLQLQATATNEVNALSDNNIEADVDDIRLQLQQAESVVQAPLLEQPPLDSTVNTGNTEDQLSLLGSSNGADEGSNPFEDIADEDIQILIDEFLGTGDLSFENSAELISKLAERLGLGEEEIRELLKALVDRLEP